MRQNFYGIAVSCLVIFSANPSIASEELFEKDIEFKVHSSVLRDMGHWYLNIKSNSELIWQPLLALRPGEHSLIYLNKSDLNRVASKLEKNGLSITVRHLTGKNPPAEELEIFSIKTISDLKAFDGKSFKIVPGGTEEHTFKMEPYTAIDQ